jgi:hypothetical protein
MNKQPDIDNINSAEQEGADTIKDADLASLHSQSKAKQIQAGKIGLKTSRRALILEANRNQIAKHNWSQELLRWLSFSKGLGAAVAVCLLVVVVWFGQQTITMTPQEIYVSDRSTKNTSADRVYANYKMIETHQLNSEVQLASATLRVKYDEAYKDYLSQKGVIAAHHQSVGRLQITERGWELTTCDDELVKVSEKIVAMLDEMQRIDTTIKVGQPISIMYAVDGRIMQIIKADEPLRC